MEIVLPIHVIKRSRTQAQPAQACIMMKQKNGGFVCHQTEKEAEAYIANIEKLKELIEEGQVVSIRQAKAWLASAVDPAG